MTTERRTLYRTLVANATSKPPWTIFLICLGVCACGFLMLGFYVRHSDNIVDAHATKGWDDLYSNISSLAFCLNLTSQEQQHTQSVPYSYREHEMINVSLPFQLIATPHQGSLPTNASSLTGTIPYFYFKFGRHILHETQMWINFESQGLFGHCIIDENKSKCMEVTYSACVTVLLPSAILPLIKPHPCNATKDSPHPSRFYIVGNRKDTRSAVTDCKKNEMQMSLSKHKSYSNEVLLSLAEKTQVNLRLQLASYVLFVILLSFLLYATLKGRSLKW